MKVTYDDEANALYIYFDNNNKPKILNRVYATYTMGNNMYLDVDKEFNALGLEILLPAHVHPQVKETLQILGKNP